jgi:hypothetical protein
MKHKLNLENITKKHGAFFAFSNKQYEEQKEDGVEYTQVGPGLVVPRNNVKQFILDFEEESSNSIKKDKEENTDKEIIWRELANHEAQITGNISDTVEALSEYGITRKQIAYEYGPGGYHDHCIENNYF